MLKNPKVSVVMAAYNGGEYIGSSIESILNQTLKDFEFIIVNDCSTDNTLDTIRSYNDERIVIFNNEKNLGQTKSLNIGVGLAKGEYIARIDADDFSYPHRLEKQVRFFNDNPEFDVVGSSGHVLNRCGKRRSISLAPVDQGEIFFKIFYDNPIIHISALIRKDKLVMLGGYDESFHIVQDYDLWSRFLINKLRLGNLKDVLVAYRVYGGSFGRKDSQDRRLIETSEILYRNIRAFTNLKIDRETAYCLRNICIVPIPGEMGYKDCEDMLSLFMKIFSNLKPEYQVDIDRRPMRSTMGKFKHNIGMNMLRKGDLNRARHMLAGSIRDRYPSMLSYIGYLLTFLNPSFGSRILEFRKRHIVKVNNG